MVCSPVTYPNLKNELRALRFIFLLPVCKNIDFNYREMEEKDLTENDQITYENYTSKNIHNSFPAYDFFDEICNSMGYFSKKKSFT